MGYWLIAAIALQLACAFCAAKLDRPAVWLQFILLVPVFGALAFCVSEVSRMLSAAGASPAASDHAAAPRGAALGGLGYRAVCARTAESRRALAEECLRLGRHADARLLLESCGDGSEADGREFVSRPKRSEKEPDRAVGAAGGAD